MIIETKQNGNTIGFAIWLEESPTVAYIWWELILPEWQNKGIGKEIIGNRPPGSQEKRLS